MNFIDLLNCLLDSLPKPFHASRSSDWPIVVLAATLSGLLLEQASERPADHFHYESPVRITKPTEALDIRTTYTVSRF
jgi:hypothetical protein